MMKPYKLWLSTFYTTFFAFITGVLFCYYCTQEYHVSYVRAINDSSFIEQALEAIPTCAPDDRASQRTSLTTLLAWTHFAREQNIQYWLGYDSLVGYVQRRGILPHDQTVDIVMMNDHTAQLVPFVNSSSPKFDTDKYILKVQPQWTIADWHNRSYFYSIGINFIHPNARFVDRKTNLHLGIFPTYNYHPIREQNSTNKNTTMLTSYDLSDDWISLPKNWTFPLRPCYFSSLKVWCPAEPEKLVAAYYGKASTFLSKQVCINGKWTSSKDYEVAKTFT